VKVLDGGCQLFEFPGRKQQEPEAPLEPRWRPMTNEEQELALAFGCHPDLLQRSHFARTMVRHALCELKITGRQSAAIFAVARGNGVVPLAPSDLHLGLIAGGYLPGPPPPKRRPRSRRARAGKK